MLNLECLTVLYLWTHLNSWRSQWLILTVLVRQFCIPNRLKLFGPTTAGSYFRPTAKSKCTIGRLPNSSDLFDLVCQDLSSRLTVWPGHRRPLPTENSWIRRRPIALLDSRLLGHYRHLRTEGRAPGNCLPREHRTAPINGSRLKLAASIDSNSAKQFAINRQPNFLVSERHLSQFLLNEQPHPSFTRLLVQQIGRILSGHSGVNYDVRQQKALSGLLNRQKRLQTLNSVRLYSAGIKFKIINSLVDWQTSGRQKRAKSPTALAIRLEASLLIKLRAKL